MKALLCFHSAQPLPVGNKTLLAAIARGALAATALPALGLVAIVRFVGDVPATAGWLPSIFLALALWTSVVVHEYGHAYFARRSTGNYDIAATPRNFTLRLNTTDQRVRLRAASGPLLAFVLGLLLYTTLFVVPVAIRLAISLPFLFHIVFVLLPNTDLYNIVNGGYHA